MLGTNPHGDGIDKECRIGSKQAVCHHAISFICFEPAVNEILKYLTFLIEAFNQILLLFKYLHIMKLHLNTS